jgi:PST family polysaccharide transporter
MSLFLGLADRASAFAGFVGRSAFVRAVGLSTAATGLRIVLGLFSVKVVAVFAGPTGIAAIGQLQSFIALQGTIAGGGISNGVITYAASYRDDEARFRRMLGSATVLTLVFASAAALLTLAFERALARELLGDEGKAWIFALSAVVAWIGALGGLVGATLNGLMMIGRLMLTGMAGTVLAFLLTVWLVVRDGAEGAIVATVLSGALGAGLTLACTVLLGWIRASTFVPRLAREDVPRLLQFTVMALATGIFGPVSLILVRNVLTSELSLAHAGYWQSIWRISEIYIQVVTIPLATYYMPRLASVGSMDAMRPVIRRGMMLIVPLVSVIALAMWLLRDVIIAVLYTKEFVAMRDLFAFQMLGDVFKIASWLISIIMVVRSMTVLLVATDLAFNASFVLLVFLFVRWFGLVGASYAFALNYFVYLVTMAVLFRGVLFERDGAGGVAAL